MRGWGVGGLRRAWYLYRDDAHLPLPPCLLQAAAEIPAADCTCLKDGVDEGYPCPDMSAGDQGVITCKLPTQDIATGATADCTVSIMETANRAWGGCVDVQMVSAAAIVPPVPPTPVVSSTGAYQITKNTVIDTSAATFTCCALEAELTIPDYENGVAASFDATLSGKANGCTAALHHTYSHCRHSPSLLPQSTLRH